MRNHTLIFWILFASAAFAADCTRGTNPFQDIKDRLNLVTDDLLKAGEGLQRGDANAAFRFADRARASWASAAADATAKYRELPVKLTSGLAELVSELRQTKARPSALVGKSRELSKGIDDVALTLSCPRTIEPVLVDTLPPDPHSGVGRIGTADFTVYAVADNRTRQLVKDLVGIPFGDCAACKRGVSLNCRSRHQKSMTTGEQQACASGLANGIGMRIVSEAQGLRLALKNGSKYSLTPPARAAIERDQPYEIGLNDAVSKQETYRVVILVK